MRRWPAIAALLSLALIPVAARADSGVEPNASSPAGAVYDIPLQTARQDAAPHRDSGDKAGGGGVTGGGGSGGGGVLPQGSAIKSENGYGSSSHVPGLSAAQAHASAHSAGTAPAAKAAAATAGAAAPAIVAANASAPATPKAPSAGASFGLVILIVLGGVAAGLVAAQAVRRALGGHPDTG